MLHLQHLAEPAIREALTASSTTALTLEAGTFSDFSFLELVPNLRELKILSCFYVEAAEYEKIGTLKNLTSLTIDYANSLTSLAFLRELPNLETLEITRCTQVTDIEPLIHNPKLKRLNLAFTGQVFISNFDPIQSLKDLEYLDLSSLIYVRDLIFLEGLKHLRYLNVNFCSLLEDIEALKNTPSLTALHMSECTRIESALGFILQRKLTQFTPPRAGDARRQAPPTNFIKI